MQQVSKQGKINVSKNFLEPGTSGAKMSQWECMALTFEG